MEDVLNSSVGDFLLHLYKTQQFTDVTFVWKTKTESVSAHRLVLAAKSPHFKEVLFKDRKRIRGFEKDIVVNNTDMDAFRKIIEYFYTNVIDLTDAFSVLEIYIGAQEFQVEPLIERCRSYLETLELTADNACSLYHKCYTNDVEFLKDRCVRFIQQNIEAVISLEDFEKYSYSTIYMISNLKSLTLRRESQILEAIVRWINAQPSHMKEDIAKPLLNCIRFLTLSSKEFSDFMRKNPNIITTEDALKIILFLNGSSSHENLPVWCNKNEEPRCIKHENVHGSVEKFHFPLKVSKDSAADSTLSFSVILVCKRGFHKIRFLNLLFDNSSKTEVELILYAAARLHRRNFFKKINEIIKSESHESNLDIRIGRGESLVIAVKIENRSTCKFLQLQDSAKIFEDKYFKCTAITKKNLFCVSEIEYETVKDTRSYYRGNETRSYHMSNSSIHSTN